MPILKAICEFKKVNDCQIKIDAYPIARAKAPAVVYIHGGALILGSRTGLSASRIQAYQDAGFAVFSIDYRLAPETKLPQIIADVEDAFAWVRGEGARFFDINPDRIAAVGSSAGGYLSLVTGTFVNKPTAIVSFYGYGDLLGDWYTKPDEFYRRTQPLYTREEAYAVVGDKEVTEGERGKFYLYCRQQGIWTNVVSGYDVEKERDKIVPFCPEFNVHADYPPTFLFHGDNDTDVPYAQSVQMAAQFKKNGVEHVFTTIHGGGHGCDGMQDNAEVKKALSDVLVFLKKHLDS